MKKLTCIIVDDEIQNQDVIEKMLEQFFPHVEVLGRAENVDGAEILIAQQKPNLVFLDVEMPGNNGFELFSRFPNPDFSVVFTTAHSDYVIRAIRSAALDFLLKPISLKELNGAIGRAYKRAERNNRDGEIRSKQFEILKKNTLENEGCREIAVQTEKGMSIINVNDVIRCEADRSSCIFHLCNGTKLIVPCMLKDYESILKHMDFVRVHRTNIVNTQHIKEYDINKGEELILSDDSHLKISSANKEEIIQTLKAI